MINWLKKFLKKSNKHYVSETDCFLNELSRTIPLSQSQELEIKKKQRIVALRDHAESNSSV